VFQRHHTVRWWWWCDDVYRMMMMRSAHSEAVTSSLFNPLFSPRWRCSQHAIFPWGHANQQSICLWKRGIYLHLLPFCSLCPLLLHSFSIFQLSGRWSSCRHSFWFIGKACPTSPNPKPITPNPRPTSPSDIHTQLSRKAI